MPFLSRQNPWSLKKFESMDKLEKWKAPSYHIFIPPTLLITQYGSSYCLLCMFYFLYPVSRQGLLPRQYFLLFSLTLSPFPFTTHSTTPLLPIACITQNIISCFILNALLQPHGFGSTMGFLPRFHLSSICISSIKPCVNWWSSELEMTADDLQYHSRDPQGPARKRQAEDAYMERLRGEKMKIW